MKLFHAIPSEKAAFAAASAKLLDHCAKESPAVAQDFAREIGKILWKLGEREESPELAPFRPLKPIKEAGRATPKRARKAPKKLYYAGKRADGNVRID